MNTSSLLCISLWIHDSSGMDADAGMDMDADAGMDMDADAGMDVIIIVILIIITN